MPSLRRMAAVAAAALSLSLMPGRSLPAQAIDSIVVGIRVRATFENPARRVVGALVRADSSGFHVAPDAGGPPVFVPIDHVRRLERSLGTRSPGQAFSRGAKTGFLIGAGVGLVATSMAVVADSRASSTEVFIPATVIVGLSSVVFTGVTTLVGGAVGMTARERWRRIRLRPPPSAG